MRDKIAEIIRNNHNGETDWDEMLDRLCDLYSVVHCGDLIKLKLNKNECNKHNN